MHPGNHFCCAPENSSAGHSGQHWILGHKADVIRSIKPGVDGQNHCQHELADDHGPRLELHRQGLFPQFLEAQSLQHRGDGKQASVDGEIPALKVERCTILNLIGYRNRCARASSGRGSPAMLLFVLHLLGDLLGVEFSELVLCKLLHLHHYFVGPQMVFHDLQSIKPSPVGSLGTTGWADWSHVQSSCPRSSRVTTPGATRNMSHAWHLSTVLRSAFRLEPPAANDRGPSLGPDGSRAKRSRAGRRLPHLADKPATDEALQGLPLPCHWPTGHVWRNSWRKICVLKRIIHPETRFCLTTPF